jgi:hypothetical protein
MKYLIVVLGSNFFFLPQHDNLIWFKLGFHSFYNLKGVLNTTLDEILFKIYIAIFSASLYKDNSIL